MAATATEPRSKKASYWAGHISGWQRSGLSQVAVCVQRSNAPSARPSAATASFERAIRGGQG
jgi:hypothetical protein